MYRIPYFLSHTLQMAYGVLRMSYSRSVSSIYIEFTAPDTYISFSVNNLRSGICLRVPDRNCYAVAVA